MPMSFLSTNRKEHDLELPVEELPCAGAITCRFHGGQVHDVDLSGASMAGEVACAAPHTNDFP